MLLASTSHKADVRPLAAPTIRPWPQQGRRSYDRIAIERGGFLAVPQQIGNSETCRHAGDAPGWLCRPGWVPPVGCRGGV